MIVASRHVWQGDIMRKFFALVIIAGLVACSLAEDATEITTAPDLEQTAVWNGSVAGSGNTAAIAGTATITEYNAYFTAELTVTGAPANVTYQWRIFSGTCTALGTQFGPNQAYPNLVMSGSGGASITRLLAGALVAGDAYSLVLRTNATNPVVVACGNLTRS
jgi:hypothetical protein